MPVLANWPRSVRIVAAVIGDLGLVVGETGTDLQQKITEHGRVFRVRRVGGADDGITDVARLDLRAYAVDLSDAEDGAELARQRLISRPWSTVHGVLDRAVTEVGPQEVPGPDPDHYRVVSATYRASIRRR